MRWPTVKIFNMIFRDDVVDGIFEPTWCSLTEGNCALALATFDSKCF